MYMLFTRENGIPSHKTLKIKKILGKKQKQNRSVPQWIRLKTGNTISLKKLDVIILTIKVVVFVFVIVKGNIPLWFYHKTDCQVTPLARDDIKKGTPSGMFQLDY
ncbi:hypothetical protein DFA_12133 [Cavenderia fasciculata]|uniref:Ribosomal protein L39 n=1 Tax=Cavenderia fasciculata TaxID=261658 RepID=F4QC80_CACFS|nr:uncharacterized protein DFA_12133 [Cavenderia fasciculata]EGG14361.1 hypothetical protein DFA_12133 [Cavenderia fasciculata]|eukprot:XP_004351085.1 hypothetical protein DFA_12133 [Cavenderia fasciculata]